MRGTVCISVPTTPNSGGGLFPSSPRDLRPWSGDGYIGSDVNLVEFHSLYSESSIDCMSNLLDVGRN